MVSCTQAASLCGFKRAMLGSRGNLAGTTYDRSPYVIEIARGRGRNLTAIDHVTEPHASTASWIRLRAQGGRRRKHAHTRGKRKLCQSADQIWRALPSARKSVGCVARCRAHILSHTAARNVPWACRTRVKSRRGEQGTCLHAPARAFLLSCARAFALESPSESIGNCTEGGGKFVDVG